MIIGFSFKKILVEKTNPLVDKVEINNNIGITKVTESDISMGKQKQKSITFEFQFTSKFEPNIGNLEFTGEIIYLSDAKTRDEVIKGWQTNKKLPKELMAEVVDTALARCNIEAIILSRDLNLPPTVPLPKIKRE